MSQTTQAAIARGGVDRGITRRHLDQVLSRPAQAIAVAPGADLERPLERGTDGTDLILLHRLLRIDAQHRLGLFRVVELEDQRLGIAPPEIIVQAVQIHVEATPSGRHRVVPHGNGRIVDQGEQGVRIRDREVGDALTAFAQLPEDLRGHEWGTGLIRMHPADQEDFHPRRARPIRGAVGHLPLPGHLERVHVKRTAKSLWDLVDWVEEANRPGSAAARETVARIPSPPRRPIPSKQPGGAG